MRTLVTAKMSKSALMDTVFSRAHLYDTRNDEDGPLSQIQKWLRREEGGVRFDLSHMKLGRDGDDFVMLYYFEGKRYKILKDGHAFVSSADADDMCEDIEKDLQTLIDTILNDELVKIVAQASANAGARIGRVKSAGDDPDIRTESIMGIVGK